MKTGIIIAAAGSSDRFGGPDKLFQDLGGRPVLIRAVEAFTKRPEVTTIVVAGPPDELEQFKNRFGATLSFHGATIVAGGRTDRWETIANAIAALPDDLTHIGVHDGARPGVSNELLARLFDAAERLPAVVPAIPIHATVKRVELKAVEVAEGEEDALADSILGGNSQPTIEARCVTETIDRTGLVAVQTPQIFEAGLLRRAYKQDGLGGATDDATLVERLGEAVHVVEGEARNFKITVQEDLEMMRKVLGLKPPAERAAHKRF